MTALKSIIFAGVTLTITAGLTSHAPAQTPSATLPPDVTEFVGRRTNCGEWSKRAIDPEQIAQIEDVYKSLRSLKCFDVIDDERALRQKYDGNKEILLSLGAGNYTKVITRLPVRIAVPSASDR